MSTTLTPALPGITSVLRDAIEDHVFSDTSREVGGVLVGHLEAEHAAIEAHIPALRASSDAAHLTFTHDTWSEILDTVDRDHADKQIVGWYHSHPGHGVFLSGYDLFIQRSFFSDPRMVALVIDPLAGDTGWFGWAGDDIAELKRTSTQRAAIAPAPGFAATQTEPRSRRGALAVMAVTGLVFATVGYAAATMLSPVNDQLDQATATVADQQAQIAELEAAAVQGEAAPPDSGAPLPQDSGAIVIHVQPGDTWWSYAEQFYGNGTRYPEIQAANPTVTELQAGEWVVVPGVQPAG